MPPRFHKGRARTIYFYIFRYSYLYRISLVLQLGFHMPFRVRLMQRPIRPARKFLLPFDIHFKNFSASKDLYFHNAYIHVIFTTYFTFFQCALFD